MSDILTVQETSLTSIADSIRKKTGKKDKLAFPAGFVSEIDSIQTGGGSAPAEEIKEKDVNFLIMTEHSLPHIPRQRRRR